MQPQVTRFSFAEETQQIEKNGTDSMQIINPVNLLRPQNIPGNYWFSVMIGLIGLNDKSVHEFEFRLIGPNGIWIWFISVITINTIGTILLYTDARIKVNSDK